MMQAHWDRRKSGEGGFTLVELLVVIAILGILAAIVTFAVVGITDRGDESACKSNVKTVEVAVEAYNAENGAYPASVAILEPDFLRDAPTVGAGQDITAYDAGSGALTDSCPA